MGIAIGTHQLWLPREIVMEIGDEVNGRGRRGASWRLASVRRPSPRHCRPVHRDHTVSWRPVRAVLDSEVAHTSSAGRDEGQGQGFLRAGSFRVVDSVIDIHAPVRLLRRQLWPK